MKKLLIGALVIGGLAVLFSWGSAQWDKMKPGATKTPAITQTVTQSKTVLEQMNDNIASLQSQLTSLKTNDQVTKATLDQILKLLNEIRAAQISQK